MCQGGFPFIRCRGKKMILTFNFQQKILCLNKRDGSSHFLFNLSDSSSNLEREVSFRSTISLSWLYCFLISFLWSTSHDIYKYRFLIHTLNIPYLILSQIIWTDILSNLRLKGVYVVFYIFGRPQPPMKKLIQSNGFTHTHLKKVLSYFVVWTMVCVIVHLFATSVNFLFTSFSTSSFSSDIYSLKESVSNFSCCLLGRVESTFTFGRPS